MVGDTRIKILVVGDSCQDVFVYGDIARISPEAPVPVFNPMKEKSNDGMARNVANNVEALGSTIYTITNKNTIRKVRYVDERSNQMVLRVDENDKCDRIDRDVLRKIQNNKCNLPMNDVVGIDAIIISDYCKGFLEEDDIKWICDNNENVFIDTKKQFGSYLDNATFIKINDLEYKKNFGLIESNGFKDKLIVTQGREGCIYKDKVYPTEDVPVKDISGAGDTFIAGLTVNYIETNDIVAAINFAQKCTKIVVQKHGVSTI
tara:strand:- start:1561 stop:2343 length:783 start_codon:yes stop_codon:yes gene_type:complete